MKRSTLLAVITAVLLILTNSQSLLGQTLLLNENFNYTAGTLLTANGWTAHSGGGTNAITVTTPLPLTYTGYLSSGIGNETSLTTSGEDDNTGFTAQTTGSLYASFLIQVSAANTAGDYFLHFCPTSGVTTGTFYVRVFAKKDASLCAALSSAFAPEMRCSEWPISSAWVRSASSARVKLFIDMPD